MASANDRIFYACQAVGIQPHASAKSQAAVGGTALDTIDIAHGVQSVGITTNFNLEQAFELGQIEIYENIEGTPDVECTMEKVLDGYPLLYHMASSGVEGTAASGLSARSKARCDVRLGIFPEEFNNIKQGGSSADAEVYMSGMYISSISYSFPTDGSSTESITLVGNNKEWIDNSTTSVIESSSVANFDGQDEPLAMGDANIPSGGISQREDFLLNACILPKSIRGVAGTGAFGNGDNSLVHLQSVSVSTDFSREEILELGAKTPYSRPATFPIEVSCEIEAITTSGDFVFAAEAGDSALNLSTASGNNTGNEMIFFATRQGYAFDLGIKNRLSSVSYGGGDAGGGNATCTYSYTNFNDLDVQDIHKGYIGPQALLGQGETISGVHYGVDRASRSYADLNIGQG